MLDTLNMTWEEVVSDMLWLVTAWVVVFMEGMEIPGLVTAWEKVDLLRLVTAWVEVGVDSFELVTVCLEFVLVVGGVVVVGPSRADSASRRWWWGLTRLGQNLGWSQQVCMQEKMLSWE